MAKDEGQSRAIVNTVLSIVGSTIATVIFSALLGRRRLNMLHIQNATLAGGVAVGAVADQCIQPFGALIIGSFAGFISVAGFEFVTPFLKRLYLHDTCKRSETGTSSVSTILLKFASTGGVGNLHGLPGVFSGLVSAIFASCANAELYGGEEK